MTTSGTNEDKATMSQLGAFQPVGVLTTEVNVTIVQTLGGQS